MSVVMAPKPGRLAAAGQWMQRHGALIRGIQWVVVALYAFLIIVPALMPLPDDTAHLWNNLTLAAQFVFWGIWWPFVLLSMVMLGRVWCGVLCPEGALAEFASKFGRGRAIPHWMRWGGWPFVAFGITTIYGQMVSVYQYPKAVLLVLGGSTFAAIVIGLLYGREKRVWCKYLCPVNGVFSLLARLAPFHYKVDEDAWRRSYTNGEHGHRVIPINCAPLVPLRNMKGAADCHMCGRCSGHRDAIALTWRKPSTEVVQLGDKKANPWDTALILYGLLGIAIGAFHWTASRWVHRPEDGRRDMARRSRHHVAPRHQRAVVPVHALPRPERRVLVARRLAADRLHPVDGARLRHRAAAIADRRDAHARAL
ncbi:polyferredoxin [Paraburkholderia sp. WC7.3d]